MTQPAKAGLRETLLAVWVLVWVADYYFQFLSGAFWRDHVLPFLRSLI